MLSDDVVFSNLVLNVFGQQGKGAVTLQLPTMQEIVNHNSDDGTDFESDVLVPSRVRWDLKLWYLALMSIPGQINIPYTWFFAWHFVLAGCTTLSKDPMENTAEMGRLPCSELKFLPQ
jgi:hypothetical protein